MPALELPGPEALVWIAMLLGLIGCFLPLIPGPPLMWLALAAYDVSLWRDGLLGWAEVASLALALGLAVAGSTADIWLSSAVARRAGASRRTVLAAMAVGGLMLLAAPFTAGLSILAALGLPFLTVVYMEQQAGKERGRAIRAGCGYLLGWALAVVVEVACGLAIVVAWIWQVGPPPGW